jgi:hypothetical protein
MIVDKNKLKYIPGTYAKKRTDVSQMADQYPSCDPYPVWHKSCSLIYLNLI